jgi:hypothetical protein
MDVERRKARLRRKLASPLANNKKRKQQLQAQLDALEKNEDVEVYVPEPVVKDYAELHTPPRKRGRPRKIKTTFETDEDSDDGLDVV